MSSQSAHVGAEHLDHFSAPGGCAGSQVPETRLGLLIWFQQQVIHCNSIVCCSDPYETLQNSAPRSFELSYPVRPREAVHSSESLSNSSTYLLGTLN